jgi:nicotinamide-nucleotide amidase
MTSCTDDEADISSAVTTAVGRADVVLCSGGLGPTEDDLTVDVMAALAGVEAVIDPPSRDKMVARFGALYANATDDLKAIQLRQVRVPAGARVFTNGAGLAPGFEIAIGGVPVACLPGIPREVHSILEGGLRARLVELREARGNVERIARRIYRVFGRGESQISAACRGLVDGVAGASIHYQVKFPETLVKVVIRDRDVRAAEARLGSIDAGVRERLPGLIYGIGDETLVGKVPRRLVEASKTVATAESCTGGMIGEMITRMPGSSRAYLGGAIVYSNHEKVRQLGVLEATLAAHGAVSEETVREMSAGARERFATTYAVAVSGVAGPDGGTPDKPVGTVWLALASETGIVTKKLNWPGSRDQIRMLTAWWALRMIDEALHA